MIAWVAALLCVFGASAELVIARGTLTRRQSSQLEQTVARGPHVLVAQLAGGSPSRSIAIPASVHGYIETPLYAKIPGYLKTIYVDKGDRVKKDQVIAILESPETDKQVADALANYKLQAITYDRYKYLLKEEVVPQQTADNWHASMLQAQAFYQQNLAMQAYEVVRAPVDGIITARYFDPGAMIPQATTPVSATTNPGFPTNNTSSPIVALATLAPLRVYAYIPQSLSPFIKDGDPAVITVDEFPSRQFPGTVTRHPDALDQNTRTMLVEVDLPNIDRSLYPGMYAEMRLTARVATTSITAPDDALVFRDNKVYLPLVRDNHLNLREVTLGHDNGYVVEVSGNDLRAGDLVAMNVGQAARNGEPVQPVRSTASNS
jgi:multidrug efflux pump subunit AcrA (membrane-fusion protein)